MSYDPYALAFPAPTFELASDDFADGGPLPLVSYNTADGANESPSLRWSDLPKGTKSVVITAFDADAPIPGGLWHWLLKDIPASEPGLPHGVGQPSVPLPASASALPNDLGQASYSGTQPPTGTGTHRMFFCATALDVETLDIPAQASSALVQILMLSHTLGRAVITATSEAPAA